MPDPPDPQPQPHPRSRKRGRFSPPSAGLHVKSEKRHHMRRNLYYSMVRGAGKASKLWRQFFSCFDGSVVGLDERIGEEVHFKTLEERMAEEWKCADLNDDGVLSEEEVTLLLRRLNVRFPDKEVHRWMKAFDNDGSGSLNFAEFRRMFAALQSVPDLTDAFLRALWMPPTDDDFRRRKAAAEDKFGEEKQGNARRRRGKFHSEGMRSSFEHVDVSRMYLTAENLVWFFAWASGGEEEKTEEACVALIARYSPNKDLTAADSNAALHRNSAARRKEGRGIRRRAASNETKVQKMISVTRMVRFKSSGGRLRKRYSSQPEIHGDSASTGVSCDIEAAPQALQMSYSSFVIMLLDGAANGLGDPRKVDHVYQDMTQPLSHYFICSSHNSYLLGNQLNSVSSPVAIIRALKLGVRVIELDAWDGSDGQPIVTHGHTLCKPTSFKECIEAIKEYGFVRSEYPCIITIENHCSMEQQMIQVDIMEAILGDALFRWPEAEHFEEDELRQCGPEQWLSPEDLKFKFVIRDRPLKRFTKNDKKARDKDKDAQKLKQNSSDQMFLRGGNILQAYKVLNSPQRQNTKDAIHESLEESAETPLRKVKKKSKDSPTGLVEIDMWESSSSDEDTTASSSLAEVDEANDGVCGPLLRLMYIKNVEPAYKKSASGQVLLIDPGFKSSSSLVEHKMRELAQPGAAAAALNTYSKDHLVRVFPAGSRITSSNYNPLPAWNAGCQIVALNYQSFGRKVWLSQGKFMDNGGCGFVLKPKQMLQAVSTGVVYDQMPVAGSKLERMFGSHKVCQSQPCQLPWALSTEAFEQTRRSLVVTIVSGHYLPKAEKNKSQVISPYVTLSVYDVDSSRQVAKTLWVQNNGFNPQWDETFRFRVLMPEMALMTFVIRSTEPSIGGTGGNGDAFVAQNAFPLKSIRPGYRVIPLMYANGASVDNAFLLCRVQWEQEDKVIGTSNSMPSKA